MSGWIGKGKRSDMTSRTKRLLETNIQATFESFGFGIFVKTQLFEVSITYDKSQQSVFIVLL